MLGTKAIATDHGSLNSPSACYVPVYPGVEMSSISDLVDASVVEKSASLGAGVPKDGTDGSVWSGSTELTC